MHNPQLDFFIRQAESSAQSKLAYVNRANTLSELARHQDADIPSVVRFMQHTLPTVRRLRTAAGQRAEELVREQLAALSKLSGDELEREISRLRSREWLHLRGNYPALARLVEHESQRLRNQS